MKVLLGFASLISGNSLKSNPESDFLLTSFQVTVGVMVLTVLSEATFFPKNT
jgi:hypothetical protein